MSVEILTATSATMHEIETWLQAEDNAYRKALAHRGRPSWDGVEIPDQGFLCNWNIVTRSFEADSENVHVLIVDGQAVGFVNAMDILEVRADRRRAGFGQVLAAFMLQRAYDLGHSVAEIEIAPSTALPFWIQMGFTAHLDRTGAGGGIYAFKVFERRHALGDGARVPYRIAFFPRDRDYDPSVEPFQVFEGDAEVLRDGDLQLPSRAYCLDPNGPTGTGCVVRVEVAGQLVTESRVGHSGARETGIQLDTGGVSFFDRIARRVRVRPAALG